MKPFRSILIFALFVSIGCSQSESPRSSQNASDAVIAKDRVGNYFLGKSTLAQILGEDTPEARRRFASEGLNFQFDRGVTLTGITVSSSKYRMANGLSVGSSTDKVREALGEPRQTEFTTNKFRIDALVYDHFTFIVNDNHVSVIFVGNQ